MTSSPIHILSTTIRIGATLTAVRPGGGAKSDLCGYLLILREFMHHLAFGDVIVEAANDPAASQAR